MIIVKESHLDHNLSAEQLDFIKKKYADRNAPFKETFELPPELGTVKVALIGPITGFEPVMENEVTYMIRGDRKWASRIFRARYEPSKNGIIMPPKRPEAPQVRQVTVITDTFNGHPCVLATAYGGPEAPREPGDPHIGSWDELSRSRDFWMEHALLAYI